jgi:glyoxylase-like metal-dependent hydrolase (beta-lactamase superfamily II)
MTMAPGSVTILPVRISFIVPAPSGPVSRFVFSFLICTDASITLIDTGVSGSEHTIFGKIRKAGRKPEDISTVILTHSHPDHMGAGKAIRDATGCTIAAHPLEKAWIEDTERQEKERPVPGFTKLVGGPVNVDRLLNDGDIITLGEGRSIEVIHTPGHSPGSISLLLRPEMALFSGDAIPVPGDLPVYDNPAESVRSIERLMNIEGIQYLFSSWDEPREGEEVYWAMDDGYAWVEQVSGAVREMVASHPGIDPTEFTLLIMKEIGLPPEAANPMVTRTITASIRTQGNTR